MHSQKKQKPIQNHMQTTNTLILPVLKKSFLTSYRSSTDKKEKKKENITESIQTEIRNENKDIPVLTSLVPSKPFCSSPSTISKLEYEFVRTPSIQSKSERRLQCCSHAYMGRRPVSDTPSYRLTSVLLRHRNGGRFHLVLQTGEFALFSSQEFRRWVHVEVVLKIGHLRGSLWLLLWSKGADASGM